jgi:electron transport complex protein RnfC
VVKGTSGIMALSPAEIDVREPLPCVRCGQCIAVCDKGLSPMMLLKYIQNGEWEKAEEWGLRTCMECGACAFVCPSNIPLVQWFKSGKATLSAKAAPNSKGS